MIASNHREGNGWPTHRPSSFNASVMRGRQAAQVQAVLITDMDQKHPVASLPVRRWPRLPRPEPALCHAHQGARMAAGQIAAIVGTILKLNDFLDEKTIASCFGTVLHSPGKLSPGLFSDPARTRRMRVSLRGRSFSRETPRHPVRALLSPRKKFEPICQGSGAQSPNPTQPDVASGRPQGKRSPGSFSYPSNSAQCEPHPA